MNSTRDLFVLLSATAAGALAGTISALLLYPTSMPVTTIVKPGTATSTVAATSTAPVISLVPVERRSAVPLVPPAFLQRRSSPLATLYHKTKGGTLDERLLSPDRLLGHAVALTSDGWFVTTASVFSGLHLADVTVWEDGASYPITHGVVDTLDNVVFFKTDAESLAIPAFAQANETAVGEQMWTETESQAFAPDVIVDASARSNPNEYSSSEVATRRFVLSSHSDAADWGGAVWDPNGSLVGIIESKAGESVRIVPASDIASSFASLLQSNEIHHASLGITALDLGDARIDGSRGDIPESGALIKLRAASAANKSSLHTGDVILSLEHDTLDGTADLGELLAEYAPGTAVNVRVLMPDVAGSYAKGRDSTLTVTLGSVITSQLLK